MKLKAPEFKTTPKRLEFFKSLYKDVNAMMIREGKNTSVDVRESGTVIGAFVSSASGGAPGPGPGGPPPPPPPGGLPPPTTHCYNMLITAVFSGDGEMIAPCGNFCGLDYGPLELGGAISGDSLGNIINPLPGTINFGQAGGGASGTGATLEFVSTNVFFPTFGQVSVQLNWTGVSWTATVSASVYAYPYRFIFGVSFNQQSFPGLSLPGGFSFSLSPGVGAWTDSYGFAWGTATNQYNCVGTVTINFC